MRAAPPWTRGAAPAVWLAGARSRLAILLVGGPAPFRAWETARPEAFGSGAIDLRRDRRPRPYSRLRNAAIGGLFSPIKRREPPIATMTKQNSGMTLQRDEPLSAHAPQPSNGTSP